MREEKIRFDIIWKILLSLLPILLGMPTLAAVLLAYHIAMSFLFLGPLTSLVASLSGVCISMLFCGAFGEGAKAQGLFLGIEAVACAAACVYTVIKKKGFYSGVWTASLAYLCVSFAQLSSLAFSAGMSVAEYLTSAPIELFRMQISLVGESEALSYNLENLIAVLEKVMQMVVPSVLVISSVLVGYAVMWLITVNLRKIPGGIAHSFATIKLPRTAVLLFLPLIVLFCLFPKGDAAYVFVNVLLVLTAGAFFAGLSLVDFYLRKVVKNTFLRILIHIFVIMCGGMLSGISPFVNTFTLYAVIAAADSFADFRKIGKKHKGGDKNEAEKREN